MGGHEAAARLEQATEQRRRECERGVRHDVVRLPRQTEIGRICLDDDDGCAEALPLVTSATRMRFDCDDTGAR